MIVGAICARADSVGIKDKNLLELDGETLLARAIQKSRACPQIDVTYISTDIPRDRWEDACDDDCYMAGRPKGLRGPLVSKWRVWQHIAKQVRATALVDIDVSRPLTTVEDVTRGVWTFLATNDADVVMAVTPAKKNPYQDILEEREDGYLAPSKTQGVYVVARQDRPAAFEHGGVYVVACDALRSTARDLWDVNVLGYDIPWVHTPSVDDPDDWAIVQALHEASRAPA